MATTSSKTPAAPPADSAPAVDTRPSGDQVSTLEAENERLRRKLTDAGISPDDPRHPKEPSFGISAGTADELERHGKATSPFTGKPLTRDDLPKSR